MWKRHAIGITACLALLGPQASEAATNQVIPGCRDFIDHTDRNPFLQGQCGGIIATIFYFGRTHFGVCRPVGSNVGQALRLVVAYVDERPERMQDDFERLALEALQQAWPCGR
jgi:hypothetical protein